MPRALESKIPLMTEGGMKRVSWIIIVISIVIIVIVIVIVIVVIIIVIIVAIIIIAVKLGGGRWTAA